MPVGNLFVLKLRKNGEVTLGDDERLIIKRDVTGDFEKTYSPIEEGGTVS